MKVFDWMMSDSSFFWLRRWIFDKFLSCVYNITVEESGTIGCWMLSSSWRARLFLTRFGWHVGTNAVSSVQLLWSRHSLYIVYTHVYLIMYIFQSSTYYYLGWRGAVPLTGITRGGDNLGDLSPSQYM